MILLDIPQGVITFGSSFLAAVVVIIVAAFGFALSLHGRVKAVETMVTPNDAERIKTTNARMEILWERHLSGAPNLTTVRPPENPMKQERWNELTNKLVQEELSDDEAEEFLSALLKREEQAQKEEDLGTLAVLEHGIILTKWKLKEKELREQK